MYKAFKGTEEARSRIITAFLRSKGDSVYVDAFVRFAGVLHASVRINDALFLLGKMCVLKMSDDPKVAELKATAWSRL